MTTEIDTRPPIERDEAIDILYDLIAKFDGHHDRQAVKQGMTKSEPFKKFANYINKHYCEESDIERD
ncbi:MAG: hypothetical protein PHF86_07800 [Candidatus Nanoarchaeia archaeon]|jgi:hypothetical protein|nr:hypothetical protein [Candidatus Nanoarchaeia archaeon]